MISDFVYLLGELEDVILFYKKLGIVKFLVEEYIDGAFKGMYKITSFEDQIDIHGNIYPLGKIL